MGNSVSLVCCQNELAKQKGEVLVIKEDGELVRFKDRTFVRDVLTAYPHHKVIRCCSERTVLQGEMQLSCSCLYFLLPVGLALTDGMYRSLVRTVATHHLVTNRPPKFNLEQNNQQKREQGNGDNTQDQMHNEYSVSYKWKPILRTIPEIASPSA